ncbi:hypothetical protein Syun_029479 [Stephania yunnanensis]|uniref:Uncharacterized protein n=1 Tax=Stephania yunnanensis TaxID=152371 RepID=A0AAP0E5F8_9MAGN
MIDEALGLKKEGQRGLSQPPIENLVPSSLAPESTKGQMPRLVNDNSNLNVRALPIRGSRTDPITSAHDLAVQSQALFNIKDSNKGVSKGLVAERMLSTMQDKGLLLDFILCIGDDRSDEDMFEVIQLR